MIVLQFLVTSLLGWVDFPVLVSTILGGVIIWILSESSKQGKLKVFITEKKVLGIYSSETGGNHETNDLNDTRITDVYLWLALDVYNSAHHVKIARKIQFEITFRAGEREITRANRGSNTITSLNFEPKKLELFHFNTKFSKNSYSMMRSLHLTFIDEKDKIKKIPVHF